MKIDKNTLLGDLLENAPEKEAILSEAGMHCISCFMAQGETIEEACMAHGIDVDDLLEELNREEN